MNKEEAIEQLYRLSLDWEENGLDTKLNQTDINAIGMVISELEIANEKIKKTKTKAKLICDIGFDYDGYENSKDLKKIIGELVKYASDILKIIGGE